MKCCFHLTIAVLLLGIGHRGASAELRLAGIFADHMVLQREQPIQLWGWAVAGDRVTVAFADQTRTAQAGDDGTWSMPLEPLQADCVGSPLRVKSGEETLIVDDVLMGEVWHASGQSNMATTVGAGHPGHPISARLATRPAFADTRSLRCRTNFTFTGNCELLLPLLGQTKFFTDGSIESDSYHESDGAHEVLARFA